MDAKDAVLILVLAIIAGAAYFFPALVANHRKVPNQGSVLVVNLFLGWTFIGWIIALAMAARSKILPIEEASAAGGKP